MRHAIGLFLLLLIVSAFVAYWHLTREERLRLYAEQWLEEFSGGEAVINQVRFNPFQGLHLVGVTIATPQAAEFDPHDNSLEARTVFRCTTVFLRLRPWSIISGSLVVPEIVAVDPEVLLVQRMSDGVGNWDVMLRNRRLSFTEGQMQLPVLRLRNARLVQGRLTERGRSGGRPQVIWADAQPLPDRPQVYDLRLNKVTDDPTGELAGDPARLQINMQTLAMSGSLPAMTIEQLLFSAPPAVARWIDLLAIQGEVRPENLSYDPHAPERFSLTLRNAALSIPLDPEEQQSPPDARYLRFSSINGKLEFDGTTAHADLEGRFHEAAIQVRGTLERGGADVATIGFELELTARSVPLPRDEPSDPVESRFVRRWKRLRDFVHDFDGIGPVDLVVHLRRAARPESVVEFVEATMTPLGVSARYARFPYRIYDLRGNVHFRPDGTVGIENLAGVHGGGRIVVDGWEGGFKTQAGELRITGQRIELDKDLLECMTPEDQALCRDFNVRALMDLDIRLTRKDAPPGTQNNPWRSEIGVTFLDGGVRYVEFPYPLERLTGHLTIADGAFDISGLRAHHGTASVDVSGRAVWDELMSPELDLSIKATRVPLDDTLAAALPEMARERYLGFGPAGQADLEGSIRSRSDTAGVDYSLVVRLVDGRITIPATGLVLSRVEAEFQLTPRHASVRALEGTIRDAPVRLSGQFDLQGAVPGFEIDAQCERLPLDEELRGALPAGVQSMWDLLRPGGSARVALTCRRAARGPSDTQPAEGGLDYRVTIEPLGCTAQCAAFPLPLRDVRGRVELTPGNARLQDVVARSAEASLAASGLVTWSDEGMRADLALQARDLVLSDELRRAFPWRVRRLWNDAQPQGRINLSLPRLHLDLPPEAAARWLAEGTAQLTGVSIQMGAELTEATGTISGTAGMHEEFTIDARAALKTVRVDGRLATDVTAQLLRSGPYVMHVSNMVGKLYGGTVLGELELDHSRNTPQYGLSLTVRDVSLADFLNAKLEPGEQPVRLQGRLDGNLSLAGRPGDVRSRQGGGDVVIRDAQMFKLPLMLAILRVVHFATQDDNAFHNATLAFKVRGSELILEEIDLRGSALSMVGAGRVQMPEEEMDLALLVGSPLKLPRVQVLSELAEGVARELMEVRVQGTPAQPQFRTEMVRSVRRTLETILNMRRQPVRTR